MVVSEYLADYRECHLSTVKCTLFAVVFIMSADHRPTSSLFGASSLLNASLTFSHSTHPLSGALQLFLTLFSFPLFSFFIFLIAWLTIGQRRTSYHFSWSLFHVTPPLDPHTLFFVFSFFFPILCLSPPMCSAMMSCKLKSIAAHKAQSWAHFLSLPNLQFFFLFSLHFLSTSTNREKRFLLLAILRLGDLILHCLFYFYHVVSSFACISALSWQCKTFCPQLSHHWNEMTWAHSDAKQLELTPEICHWVDCVYLGSGREHWQTLRHLIHLSIASQSCPSLFVFLKNSFKYHGQGAA